MPNDHRILAELKRCMRAADGDEAAMAVCEQAFTDEGGVVTSEGGKVFTAPDNTEGFVTTGGKVF